MTTKFKYIRDISGTVSNILPLSDKTETMNLSYSKSTDFFDLPSESAFYMVIFKSLSNNIDDQTAAMIKVGVRFYPYPPSDSFYSNPDSKPLALVIPGGARIYVSTARPDVDRDVLVHALIYAVSEEQGREVIQEDPVLLGITVVPNNPVSLPVGKEQQFTASGYYSDDIFRDITGEVTWRVDLEEVAKWKNSTAYPGLLLAVSEGAAVVDATFDTIISNEVNVTVSPAIVESIDIQPKNKNVNIGQQQQYTCTATLSNETTQVLTHSDGLEWYITNDAIGTLAIINEDGLCTANSGGTAIIGAYYVQPGGDIIAEPTALFISASEKANLISISLYPTATNTAPLEIAKGRTQQFMAIGNYSDGTSQDLTNIASWSTTNPEKIYFDSDPLKKGLLHAADITTDNKIVYAALYGVTTVDQCYIKVLPPAVESLEITPMCTNKNPGESEIYTCTATLSDDTRKVLTHADGLGWYSPNDPQQELVSIDDNTGTVTAIKQGLAKIGAYLGIIIAEPMDFMVNMPSSSLNMWKPGDERLLSVENDPEGWFIEDGREVSRTQYALLYASETICDPNSTGSLAYGNKSKYGESGCFANSVVIPHQEGQVLIVNMVASENLYPESIVGLNGFILVPLSDTPTRGRKIICTAADSFDPSSGYIKIYTASSSGIALDWYIVFINDGVVNIHPDVPINTSHRICYVYINSGMTSRQVADAMADSCNSIGFKIPDYRGYGIRIWDNNAGIDTGASTRTGRVDGLNGDHVGTLQEDDNKSHKHNLIQLVLDSIPGSVTSLFLDPAALDCPFTPLAISEQGIYTEYQKTGFMNNHGNMKSFTDNVGTESRMKNKNISMLIKY